MKMTLIVCPKEKKKVISKIKSVDTYKRVDHYKSVNFFALLLCLLSVN